MEDLSLEEVKQLLIFYKQKSSDLEFNLLQLQIKLNKINSLEDLSIKKSNNKNTEKK